MAHIEAPGRLTAGDKLLIRKDRSLDWAYPSHLDSACTPAAGMDSIALLVAITQY